MIPADVTFRRFATLERDEPSASYTATGYAGRFMDWMVPEDEWWILAAARWRYVSVASNLTASGDIVYAFNVLRTVQFSNAFDVIGRRVGIEQLIWARYIRYGIDYTEPQYGPPAGNLAVLPPGSRVTLLAQAFGTSIPPYFPSIVAPGSIDVNVYALNDQPGVIPGAGTISVPRIAEWWKQ